MTPVRTARVRREERRASLALALRTLDDHDEHSMCEAPPATWAAPWHEPSPGLRAIDCGDTRNVFYAREVAR